MPCSRMYPRICASTRSAVRRSASSRSAIRFPLRKKLLDGARGLRRGRRPCPPAGAAAAPPARRSTSSISSARSRIESGTVSRTLDARDLGDDVVQALDVLDVERRVHVDPGVEQLVDVLPALGVPGAGRVRVGELVDEESAGCRASAASRSNSSSVVPAVLDGIARENLEPLDRAPSVSARPCVSTTPTTTSTPCAPLRARGLQHRVGLAHAGRGAEEDLQLPAAARSSSSRDALRAAPRDRVASVMRSDHSGLSGARIAQAVEREIEEQHVDARLAEEPERAAPRCAAATSARTRSASRPRARATRGDLESRVARARCAGRAPTRTRSPGRPAPCASHGAVRRDRAVDRAARSSVSASLRSVGPLLVPADAVAS